MGILIRMMIWGVGLLIVLLVVGLVRSRLNEPDLRAETPWSTETSFLETRSGRVHIYDQGPADNPDAPIILFFHGSARSVADMEEVLGPLLIANHRVIAIDHYGFGLSDRGHGWSYGLGHWAEQGADVLDALGIEEPVYISGHSSGAATAAIFASRHGDRTKGVIFLGHGIAITPLQIPLLLPGLGEVAFSGPMPHVPDISPVYREHMEQAFRLRGTRHAMMVFVRRQYTIDGMELVGKTYENIAVPVLQIHGTEDEEIPISAAQIVQGRLQDTRLHIIEGAPHNSHLTNAPEVAEVITAFVAETEAAN